MADAQAAGKKGAEASSEKAAPSPHAKRSTWGASPPNPLSYLFFYFVGPLISRGYEARLEPDDLYETDDVKAENVRASVIQVYTLSPAPTNLACAPAPLLTVSGSRRSSTLC